MSGKRCSRCGITKPVDRFYNDCTQKDGKTRRCQDCAKVVSKTWRETDSGRAREKWRAASRKYDRGTGLFRKYGIDDSDYERILKSQGGRCAVCKVLAENSKGRNPGRLVVDHDHVSGLVRGLICSPCNTGLGLLGDDPLKLEAAVLYLKKRAAL